MNDMKQLKTLITLFLLVIGTSISWAQDDEASIPKRTATWNWKDGVPAGIYAESNLENTKGYVHSDDNPASLKLEVDATGGSFTAVKSGIVYYAKLTNNCKIKVPVRRAEDKVTITCQSKYNYKIGNATVNKQTYTYNVSASDAAQGYVLITAIGEVQFHQIEVVQNKFSSDFPMISLNCRGWASFTSLIPGYVVKLPSTATAYVATDVFPDEGDYGSVMLTKVDRFGYGEGVFIHGDAYAEVYPTTVQGTSTVPKSDNLTVGCTDNVDLTYESCAYVIATKGADEEAGFYYVNTDITVPAGKAYLYNPYAKTRMSRANALKITFADGSEATGIESLFAGAQKDETPAVFYNLSGQKVDKNYKGIVIGTDGKKYVK